VSGRLRVQITSGSSFLLFCRSSFVWYIRWG